MSDIKPVFYEFVLADGTKVLCTRNYGGLLLLRGYDRELYEASQVIGTKAGAPDDIEQAELLYAAYVTAKLMRNERNDIMDKMEFLTMIPVSRPYIDGFFNKLFGISQKKMISKKGSGEKQED